MYVYKETRRPADCIKGLEIGLLILNLACGNLRIGNIHIL